MFKKASHYAADLSDNCRSGEWNAAAISGIAYRIDRVFAWMRKDTCGKIQHISRPSVITETIPKTTVIADNGHAFFIIFDDSRLNVGKPEKESPIPFIDQNTMGIVKVDIVTDDSFFVLGETGKIHGDHRYGSHHGHHVTGDIFVCFSEGPVQP